MSEELKAALRQHLEVTKIVGQALAETADGLMEGAAQLESIAASLQSAAKAQKTVIIPSLRKMQDIVTESCQLTEHCMALLTASEAA